ncbi:hypothetical protein OIU76_008278 [Salix suchowensis]|uniref:Uncharacterized protein n=1 Tax=Salix suchowensis TaxID=1278906 RepID=A0ABQ9BSN7_9ROSI|nr:ABC transporter family member [Salix suchowensis]KAJ6338790.1 hypothetical protein OIU76_008278 [Salix suchowensis]KAJ6390193.1 hypothetical protein OIU77_024414 [Salix suchowensis]
MGNCLASGKIVSQNAKLEQQSEEDELVLIKQAPTSLASSRRESPKHAERGKAEMVRLGLDEGVKAGKDGEMGETTTSKGGGAVRIRVVVTREELKQILNFRKNMKNSSVEEIIGALRLRERRADRGEIMSSSWKPVLDSIPEEH